MSGKTSLTAMEQTWDSIVADTTRLNALITDKNKLREFGILSHAILDVESNIGVISAFIGPKVPVAEYNTLRNAWENLKAKLDVFA